MSCVELVHMMFMIITRCLSTKYSLLLFWHYSIFFSVFPTPCCPRPVHPCDCLKFTSPPCSRSCSDVVARCVDPSSSQAVPICSYVVVPSVLSISISGLSLAGLHQLCLPRLFLILTFGIMSHREMLKIFRSIFL